MDNQESEATFADLVEMLIQLRMSWVVEQVNEAVRFGKTEIREVRTYVESVKPQQTRIFDQFRPTLKEGSKANLPATIEYTPQEKLRLMVDAIEQVTIDVDSMRDQLLLFLVEETGGNGSIAFYPDEINVPPRLQLNPNQPPQVNMHQLKQLLDELRSNI